MNLYPITCDEAYYWLWHKYLSLSFVDHPPVIAYFNKFISLFGENNLFNFRFSAIILSFIVTFYIYKITCLLFNKRTAIIAATISQLVPHYIFIWQTLTMDNLLAVFWVIALYVVVKIYKNHNYKDWYLLGIIFGLGMLTKYTMIFFIPPLFISMLSIKELRKWFFSPHPYCGIIISIFIFSPVILWNIQNNFISLAFHANRLEIQSPINNFIQVILDQLVKRIGEKFTS
jgi:4-amino-4-deoxy-L-arabinose transferase-like glycosyltransferase